MDVVLFSCLIIFSVYLIIIILVLKSSLESSPIELMEDVNLEDVISTLEISQSVPRGTVEPVGRPQELREKIHGEGSAGVKSEPFSLEEWFRQVRETVKEQTQPLVEADNVEAVAGLEKPTREQLAILKENLRIEKGSLQFKDGSIYSVTAEGKKRIWKRLGRWRDFSISLTAPHS